MRQRISAIVIASAICAAVAHGQSTINVDELMEDPENLVFQEDFSDESSLQRFVFSSPDHWQRVKAGDRWALEHRHAGSAYQPPYRSPHNIALIATPACGKFVLEYEAQQTGREYGHRDACVFFSFVDPAHYYYAHIATNRDPHAHQIFTVNDAPRTMITQSGTDGFDWGPQDSWHPIRVVRDVESGLIEVYIDQMERPIMKASDTSHGMGHIGFGSFDDTGRVTNIRLYSNDIEMRRPTFFQGK